MSSLRLSVSFSVKWSVEGKRQSQERGEVKREEVEVKMLHFASVTQ